MKFRKNAFNAAIRIPYRPPQALMYFVTFNHVGAAVCLFFVSLPLWLIGLLLMLLTTHYWFFIQTFRKQRRPEVCPQLCLGMENEWSLVCGNNEKLSMRLQTRHWYTAY